MGLTFVPAASGEMDSLGDEGWPLAHYLLHPPGPQPSPVWQISRQPPSDADPADSRRAALEALIIAAFGP
ncbi:hypothetical protein [Neogemmobacter tilapiae]|uniref:Uncharacterized protein n=1 Tax=Neogemmobacter tilapiae TaxID=875041 RepID=A0A918TUQ9_9RHOB|nr:hypothetical protein [Gemmobacter tilapiae]GHC64254.1 hypothetical protein GCM10007315_30770 [Gemmobacter tilapiae]